MKRTDFVGIMVPNPSHRKIALRTFLNNNATGKRLFCFAPSGIDWKNKSIVGLHRLNQKWIFSKFPFPQVIYNRCYKINHELIERLKTEIGSDNWFNHFNQFNKQEIHELLSRGLVPFLPETVPYTIENALHMLATHQVVYLKPCYGHAGNGVYRLKLQQNVGIHIGHHYFLSNTIARDAVQFQEKLDQLIGSVPYIIQQGIPMQQWNDQTFDLRVLVQKNGMGLWSATSVISRMAYEGCYNTSVCNKVYATGKLLRRLYSPEIAGHIMDTIRDTSLMAAKLVESEAGYHLGELSVDFALEAGGKVWLIEVNGKPDKSLHHGIPGCRLIYRRPMQYAGYLCRKNPSR